MCATPSTRVMQPVGVLLGGSGRVRAQVLPPRRLAALLRPAALAAGADSVRAMASVSLAAA
jgi:tetrahydromethanopterin S-methyltransferase subunit C